MVITHRAIVIGFFLLAGSASLLRAQDETRPIPKPSPAKIEPQIVILPESIIEIEWTHTLKLVNAPTNVTRLNPGQCVRLGIYSTGDNRDDYLKNTKLSFSVQFAGKTDAHPFASLSELKQIKPEGGDFVAAALAAGGVKMPEQMKTTATLGVSGEHWCAPINASDGSATAQAEVETPSGLRSLTSSTIAVESFETGGEKPFKGDQEIDAFTRTYYRQPNPARLLPALQFIVANQTKRARGAQVEILAAFVTAALKSEPQAGEDFRKRIGAQPSLTRALGLMVLQSAGYDIGSALSALSEEERIKFLSLPHLQDPFDLSPTSDLFQHLDMMWAVYMATGDFKAVQTIASLLGWRADYEAFDRLRNTPNHPSTLTPSIVRGVTYTAAGWSLWSFQRNDPLVADYIEYLLASPDTSDSIKTELRGLSNNPAFKSPKGR